MSNLNNVQLRRLDLTLLLVFDETMRRRKLGAVAETLGLTPSAISHALARLRDVFQDELFQRQGQSIVPTHRARDMAPAIHAAIQGLSGALAPQTFDPGQARRVIRIAALDYSVAMFGLGMVRKIAAQAPGLQLSIASLGRDTVADGIVKGKIDLGIGVFEPHNDAIVRRFLRHEHFVAVVRKDHPEVRSRLSLKRFAGLDHVLVSGSGDLRGPLDEALARQGLKRRVIASVPQFLASLSMVSATDAVASVPSSIARQHAKAFNLRVLPLPLEVPPFEVVAIHAAQAQSDPVLQWLLEAIKP
jgi:DNA-binding transcriptional LysR family regulator